MLTSTDFFFIISVHNFSCDENLEISNCPIYVLNHMVIRKKKLMLSHVYKIKRSNFYSKITFLHEFIDQILYNLIACMYRRRKSTLALGWKYINYFITRGEGVGIKYHEWKLHMHVNLMVLRIWYMYNCYIETMQFSSSVLAFWKRSIITIIIIIIVKRYYQRKMEKSILFYINALFVLLNNLWSNFNSCL